tara:strand:+ start:451 stop:615 length:165 start_codon:yes stop_codon:yes gene_type:complete
MQTDGGTCNGEPFDGLLVKTSGKYAAANDVSRFLASNLVMIFPTCGFVTESRIT